MFRRPLSKLERQRILTSNDGFQKLPRALGLSLVAILAVYSVYVAFFVSMEQVEAEEEMLKFRLWTPRKQAAHVSEKCRKIAEKYDGCKAGSKMPTSIVAVEGKSPSFRESVADLTVVCNFDLVTDLAYLPDRELFECVENMPPVAWGKDSKFLQKRIDELQNPKNCEKPKSTDYQAPCWTPKKDSHGEWQREHCQEPLMNKSRPKWHLLKWLNHGWAYNLFVFAFSAGNHWAKGVPVIVGNSKYRFSDMDCGRGYSCHLTELSRCKIEDVDPKNVLVYGIGEVDRSVMTMDQLCLPAGKYSLEYGRCDCPQGYLPGAGSQYTYCIPYSAIDMTIERKKDHVEFYEKYKMIALKGDEVWFANNAPGEENPHNNQDFVHYHTPSHMRKKHGFLWEHAQSVLYLMKNNRKKPRLELLREELGLKSGGRCIAMHVRHGDSCHDRYQNHRVCLPLESFVKAARKLVSVYGNFDKVFVATDDPQVINDTAQFKNEFKFVYQSQDRAFYETGDAVGVDVRKDFNSRLRVNEIVSDIWLMGHCDAFVGSFASSVAWIAYEYMSANKGFYAPFVSVDLPYAHKKNVGRFGGFDV